MKTMTVQPLVLFLSALSLLAVAAPADADEVTLTPNRDNTIYSENGGTSNGSGAHLFAGRTNQGQVRRALLAFDVAGNIPGGSTIESATLRLEMSRTFSGAQTMTLHRILSDWGEGTSNAAANEGAGAPATSGDATWTHAFFDTTTWANQGGNFAAPASASRSVASEGAYTWGSSAEMVADVQSWLDTPAASFGWILLGNETADRTSKRFNSRENTSAGARPLLTIVFSSGTPQDTPTPSHTPTGTVTPTEMAADTATPTATSQPTGPCPGDCNEDGSVTINELINAVNIALGQSDLSSCPAADRGQDGNVTVDDLIVAVNAALNGCP